MVGPFLLAVGGSMIADLQQREPSGQYSRVRLRYGWADHLPRDPPRIAGTQLYLLLRQRQLPYGELSEAALTEACTRLVSHMVVEHDIDLVVIACNTASTIALPSLRAAMTVPVVGVVPAIKPALRYPQWLHRLAGNPGTVSREYTHELIAQFAPGKRVLLKGRPSW